MPTYEDGVLRRMRVRVNDQKHLRDLILFLRECGCVAEQASAGDADVYAPAAPDDRAAREEVRICIAAWRIKSGGDASIIE